MQEILFNLLSTLARAVGQWLAVSVPVALGATFVVGGYPFQADFTVRGMR